MDPEKAANASTTKVKLGDLLVVFEDAFHAGWNSALVRAEYGIGKEEAFRLWLDEEMKRLGIG
jgi:hypothetical protein